MKQSKRRLLVTAAVSAFVAYLHGWTAALLFRAHENELGQVAAIVAGVCALALIPLMAMAFDPYSQ